MHKGYFKTYLMLFNQMLKYPSYYERLSLHITEQQVHENQEQLPKIYLLTKFTKEIRDWGFFFQP